MNCEQIRGDLIAYLKGELQGRRKEQIEAHLAQCPACRKELEEAKRVLEWTEAANEAAAIKKVDEIIAQAISSSATDIHLETQRDGSLLFRQRIDGVLYEVEQIDSAQRLAVLARVKMLANMNVGDINLPQDGRFFWGLDDMQFDLRVSSIPLINGESIAIRLLDRSAGPIHMENTGISEEDLQKLNRLLHMPTGMLLISGPSGCGKTTILYALMSTLPRNDRKIMTVENPVEHSFSGVYQIEVNWQTGMTYPVALRAILRHDPDVIAVGAIKDHETAMLCIEAAIRGHMLISTVHASDAVEVMSRFREMGVEDTMIASSIVGASCQRLVRKVCENCKEQVQVDPDDQSIKSLRITAEELASGTFYRGKGCESCLRTGFKGRSAVFEVLELDEELAVLIKGGAPASKIRQAAMWGGQKTMRDDAKRKVLAGITTPEEACRVLPWSIYYEQE